MKSIVRAHLKYNTSQKEPHEIIDIKLSICGSILTLFVNQTCSSGIRTDFPDHKEPKSNAICIRSDGVGVSHLNLDTQRRFLRRKRDVVATLKNTRQENKRIVVVPHKSLTKFKSLDRKLYIGENTANLNEINILKSLKHKNVIKLTQFYSSDTKLITIYQQCINSLDNILRTVSCDTIKTQYARQIIDGVNYIHMSNIIHCNLIPKNILLTYDHTIKITNFTHSRTNDKFYTDILNTPYDPPEIEWNTSRDVYAIGRLLVDLNIKTIPGLLAEIPRHRLCYIDDKTYNIKMVLVHFKRPQKAKPVGVISESMCDLSYEGSHVYILPAAIKQQLL